MTLTVAKNTQDAWIELGKYYSVAMVVYEHYNLKSSYKDFEHFVRKILDAYRKGFTIDQWKNRSRKNEILLKYYL